MTFGATAARRHAPGGFRAAASTAPSAGFTLIELLVVIAIIAILAAILFPVFAQVREKARQVACISNTKQIGAALLQYAQDFDETTPASWFGSSSGTSDATDNYKWMDAVQPYVKNGGVFHCPSDSLNPAYAFRSLDNYGSYGLNSAYRGAEAPPLTITTTPPVNQSLAMFARPAETVLVVDTSVKGGAAFEVEWIDRFSADALVVEERPRRLDTVVERHQGTVSVLWCDGHAKATKLDALTRKNVYQIMTAFTIEED